MDWNTLVISTQVSGTMRSLPADLTQNAQKTVTLAFAIGECGSETWAGLPGDMVATPNVPLLASAGIEYVVGTGGSGGIFTCGSDAGMSTFLGRWASAGLIGVDYDIEEGQTQAMVAALLQRIAAARATYPGLRFSLTLQTLANNAGGSTAVSLGASAPDSFNPGGDTVMAAVKSTLGFDGTPATWPSYLTVNLMVMDYGVPSSANCVVAGGVCQMGQSALQAAYNLHDKWGVPYASIELTPMIGLNDVGGNRFLVADADTLAKFALAQGLGGVHYWAYDRDTDCPPSTGVSSTCNSLGTAGTLGFLKQFQSSGL